jgi:adenylate kinase
LKKAIIVSGSVATGKTTFAKKFSKKNNYEYLDVTSFIKENELCDSFDSKRKCYVVDINKLNRKLYSLIKNSKKTLVIDSHMSHYLNPNYVKLCYILKCDLKKLKKRLEKRKYTQLKIKENLDAEIFDVCYEEAKKKKHKIKIVNT